MTWRIGPTATGILARLAIVALLGTTVLSMAAWRMTSPSGVRKGGSLTVLESSGAGGEWPGLDPATNTSDYADVPIMDAIYGGLFQFGTHGKVIPDLASGYKFTNGGMSLEITLRKGGVFQDGTAFNASAVAFNIRRDLEPQYACMCAPNFPVSSVTTPNDYTVVLNLTRVYSQIVAGFYGASPNWIASPTALSKMGERAFALSPVAAGPFEVVRDVPNSTLVLKRNPHYWERGHPYIDSLTFTSVGADESAYDALLSGQGQAYQAVSTYSLLATAAGHFKVTPNLESLAPTGIQLNTTKAPFNNLMAREAIYYATNPAPIIKSLLAGRGTATEPPSIPGGLFYKPKIPGYRTYDLAKAKSLVKQVGGLSLTLITSQAQSGIEMAEALKTEWGKAGIQTTISPQGIPAEVQTFKADDWQATFGYLGGADPGLAMPIRYASDGAFSGIHDPHLDALLDAGTSTLSAAKQSQIFTNLYRYISDQAYTPFLFVSSLYNLSARSVSGPGLTDASALEALWQDVSVK
jgi:peptide/nickel transport system substrate-binding protein